MQSDFGVRHDAAVDLLPNQYDYYLHWMPTPARTPSTFDLIALTCKSHLADEVKVKRS